MLPAPAQQSSSCADRRVAICILARVSKTMAGTRCTSSARELVSMQSRPDQQRMAASSQLEILHQPRERLA